MNNEKIAKILNLESVIFDMRKKDETVPDNLLINLNKMYNTLTDDELTYVEKKLKAKLVEDYDEILIKGK
jgi:hypothetical protein